MDSATRNAALKLLWNAAVVFWDFDGVVKDSVAVKSDAFERLFQRYGDAVAARVRAHHEAHGGISRYEKIPIYLRWAGESADPEQVQHFCDEFAGLVRQAVVDSPWVPGAREYLLEHSAVKRFVLLSATPHEEIVSIIATLGIQHCFREVHGAPAPKASSIEGVLDRWGCEPGCALMIGDADADLAAARATGVPFLLRCTPLNGTLQSMHRGPMFDDFTRDNHE